MPPASTKVIESVSDSSDSIILTVRSEGGVAECPLCGARSRRIHSRYDRQVADLPCAGKQIRLRVITRRFVCEVPHCRRQIFAERFGDDVLPTWSRRTARLESIVHHLGLALGGRPAASFAKRLMLPVSNDTLLRVVRRRTASRADPLTVVGVDVGRGNVLCRHCGRRLPRRSLLQREQSSAGLRCQTSEQLPGDASPPVPVARFPNQPDGKGRWIASRRPHRSAQISCRGLNDICCHPQGVGKLHDLVSTS
jgi:hypothetical protein